MHLGNIDFDKRELIIQSEKSHRMDSLIIPLDLFTGIVEFINCHAKEIEAAQGDYNEVHSEGQRRAIQEHRLRI